MLGKPLLIHKPFRKTFPNDQNLNNFTYYD